MFEDHFMDMKDLSEGMWVSAWRCMNCGHAVDPVMVANRLRQAAWGADEQHIAQELIDTYSSSIALSPYREGC